VCVLLTLLPPRVPYEHLTVGGKESLLRGGKENLLPSMYRRDREICSRIRQLNWSDVK
jgi:hypothetical protein